MSRRVEKPMQTSLKKKQIGGFGESIEGSRKRAFELSIREIVELKKERPGSFF